MRKLTEHEYNLALAILVKYFHEDAFFDKVEKLTRINLYESALNDSSSKLFDSLLDFLEVPKDETLENEHGYCRDWIGEIQADLMGDTRRSSIEKAKIFLDKIIDGNN
jgi:hypothetical protein